MILYRGEPQIKKLLRLTSGLHILADSSIRCDGASDGSCSDDSNVFDYSTPSTSGFHLQGHIMMADGRSSANDKRQLRKEQAGHFGPLLYEIRSK